MLEPGKCLSCLSLGSAVAVIPPRLGYRVQRFNVFAWEFGCWQLRNRSFQFGSRDGLPIENLTTPPAS